MNLVSGTLQEYRICRYLEDLLGRIKKMEMRAYERGRIRSYERLQNLLEKREMELTLFVHRFHLNLIRYEVILYNRKRIARSFLSGFFLSDEEEHRFEILDKVCRFFDLKIKPNYTKEEKETKFKMTKRYNEVFYMRICKACERLCRERGLRSYVYAKEIPAISPLSHQRLFRLSMKIEKPGCFSQTFHSEYYRMTPVTKKYVYLEALGMVSLAANAFILSIIF